MPSLSRACDIDFSSVYASSRVATGCSSTKSGEIGEYHDIPTYMHNTLSRASIYGTFAHPCARTAPTNGNRLIPSSNSRAPIVLGTEKCNNEKKFLVRL